MHVRRHYHEEINAMFDQEGNDRDGTTTRSVHIDFPKFDGSDHVGYI
jgi:hypothetical protein